MLFDQGSTLAHRHKCQRSHHRQQQSCGELRAPRPRVLRPGSGGKGYGPFFSLKAPDWWYFCQPKEVGLACSLLEPPGTTTTSNPFSASQPGCDTNSGPTSVTAILGGAGGENAVSEAGDAVAAQMVTTFPRELGRAVDTAAPWAGRPWSPAGGLFNPASCRIRDDCRRPWLSTSKALRAFSAPGCRALPFAEGYSSRTATRTAVMVEQIQANEVWIRTQEQEKNKFLTCRCSNVCCFISKRF